MRKALIPGILLITAVALTGCSSAGSSTPSASESIPLASGVPTAPPAIEYVPADASLTLDKGELVIIPIATADSGGLPAGWGVSPSKVLKLAPAMDPNDPRLTDVETFGGTVTSGYTGILFEAVEKGQDTLTVNYTGPDGTPVSVKMTVTVK